MIRLAIATVVLCLASAPIHAFASDRVKTSDTAMSDLMLAAIIAASATLIVAFLNSIVAELFRRHKDRVALAAGIAGELASYEPALPILQKVLSDTIHAVETGNRGVIGYRPFEKPKDLVFEKAVEKLGLLGPKLVEDIVYVYGNLNAFRTSLGLISTHFKEMPDEELRARSTACLEALNRAAQRGGPLVVALKRVAGV